MHPHFTSKRETGSTRGFSTVDPERQGVLALGRSLSALAQSRSASAPVAAMAPGRQAVEDERFAKMDGIRPGKKA